MTKEQQAYKEALPAIIAFTESKTIQVSDRKGIPNWTDYDGEFPDFSNINWQWRVKPTPTLRPWRPEEVPVGAWVRSKSSHETGFTGFASIIGVSKDSFYTVENNFEDMCSELAKSLNYVHSLDHGKTWLPCGVVTES